MKIGVDFGGVIVKIADENRLLDACAGLELMMPGAFDGMAELMQIFEGNVWIVSKASIPTQAATRQWLGRNGFYQHTGFDPSHLCFCSKRQEKAAISTTLKLTHFIDDSPEVLQHLEGKVSNLYLFGSKEVSSWEKILLEIQSGLLGNGT